MDTNPRIQNHLGNIEDLGADFTVYINQSIKVNPPKNTIRITNKRFQFMSYSFNSGANIQKNSQTKK